MKTLNQAKIKNETEKSIDTFLESISVTFKVYPAGTGLVRDGWECDGWRAEFRSKAGTVELFDYYTGIGHRITEWNNQEHKPFTPFAAAVLYCLILDSSANDQSFNDWCEEYGYSNDSMKVFKTYQQCCETAEKMRKIFTREQIEELSELLQDY